MDEMLGSRPDLRPGALALQGEAELGGLGGRAVVGKAWRRKQRRESQERDSSEHGQDNSSFGQVGDKPCLVF
jgi:hypothetical protein